MKRRALLTLLLGLALIGCGRPGPTASIAERPAAAPTMSLRDLHAVGELRDTFNQDVGKPRLLLLVSPT